MWYSTGQLHNPDTRLSGMANDVPEESITRRVGARLRILRRQRRWTVADLCHAAAMAGADLSPGVMYKLERGERGASLSVATLLILAYVLDVSPLVLLLPTENERVPVTRTRGMLAQHMYEWIVGARPATLGDDDERRRLVRIRMQDAFLRFYLPYVVDSTREPLPDPVSLDAATITQLILDITEGENNAGL